jgi:pimeloyl-ACP methyl ester carboxylesterase
MIALALCRPVFAQSKESLMTRHASSPTAYRTVKVDDLSIFYRDAGPSGAPTLLLLHGFPSSSRMFEPLFARLSAYPTWQAWLQKTQPRLLVLWGKHDPSFDPGEPERYRKDVPNAEVHVFDAGHFALDAEADAIAERVAPFLQGSK